jgi:hypothetical protein
LKPLHIVEPAEIEFREATAFMNRLRQALMPTRSGGSSTLKPGVILSREDGEGSVSDKRFA